MLKHYPNTANNLLVASVFFLLATLIWTNVFVVYADSGLCFCETIDLELEDNVEDDLKEIEELEKRQRTTTVIAYKANIHLRGTLASNLAATTLNRYRSSYHPEVTTPPPEA